MRNWMPYAIKATVLIVCVPAFAAALFVGLACWAFTWIGEVPDPHGMALTAVFGLAAGAIAALATYAATDA